MYIYKQKHVYKHTRNQICVTARRREKENIAGLQKWSGRRILHCSNAFNLCFEIS